MDIGALLAQNNPWWADSDSRRRRPKPRRRRIPFQHLQAAATAPGAKSLVLRGPRRVGKTQLLLQLVDHLLGDVGLPPGRLLYLDLSDPLVGALGRGPEALNALLRAWPPGSAPGPRIALLDELQTVPNWDSWLKHTLDWNEDLRVIATGSSSLALAAGGRESGRGRWEDLILEGLTFPERLDLLASEEEPIERVLSRRPQLYREHLELGGLPEYLGTRDSRVEVRRHMRAEVDRDLAADLAGGSVRDVDVTRRLFLTFAQESGAMHKRQKLASALGVDRNTLDRHIQALYDMLLLQKLGPLTSTPGGATRNVRARLADEKVYVGEPGHVAAFSAALDPLENGTVAGRIYETTVFHALRSVARELDCAEIGYLRVDEGKEIDFVLSLPEGMVGIEVTASARVDKKVSKALEAGETFGVPMLLVTGAADEGIGGRVPCVDLQRFLLAPAAAIRRLLT